MKSAIEGYFVGAGDLDRTIQLLTVTTTQDTVGQPVETVTVGQSLRAQRVSLVTADYTRAQTMGAVAMAKYNIRYVDGITAGQRLREDTTDYYIISVEQVGRRKGLILLCKA